jgi:hypothetical protein
LEVLLAAHDQPDAVLGDADGKPTPQCACGTRLDSVF